MDLYVMISRTNTGVAKLIRAVSRYPYNHVSLSLDPGFQSWSSFARYNMDTPLYGGYIRESAARFFEKGRDANVRIFRLPISREKYLRLQQLFEKAGDPGSGLIYNLFDAIAYPLGRSVPVSGAYTCLGFANSVLETDYSSIRQLDRGLSGHLYYEGPFSRVVQPDGRNDLYFTRLGLGRGLWRSVKQFARLSKRACSREYTDIIRQQLQ